MDRRRFLAAVGAAGYAGLSGCGSDTDGSAPSTTTETRRTRSVPAPEIGALDYRLDDPESAIGSRTIQITGETTGANGVVEITVSDGTTTTVDDGAFETAVDLRGGQRYSLTVQASNESGTASDDVDLGYVPAPTTLVDGDRLVGAHYYVWWGADWHWDEGYPGTPVLGEYSARDPSVVEKHVEWATEHGINWFSVSWWGRDSWSDVTLRDHFPEARRSDEIAISILYEPHATLDVSRGWRVDFDDPDNRTQFADDIEYLAETYFDRDNYLHIDGRPVVYTYLAQGFMGDVAGAFEEAAEAADVRPYLIGDFEVGKWDPVHRDLIGQFDAVSDYVPFYDDRADVEDRYPGAVLDAARQWMLALDDTDVDFVPGVGPGFDKSHHSDGGDLAVLDPDPEAFAEYCRGTLRQFDPEVNAALVTSFNEWYEGTVLEPAEEWETRYLEIVRDTLSTPEATYENRDRYGTVVVDFESLVPEAELNPDAGRFARDLGFQLYELTLLDENDRPVKSYDVGTTDEPIFVEGAFHGGEHDGDTWRWLGGPTGRAAFAVPWEVLSPVRGVRLSGSPPNHSTTVSATLSVENIGERDVSFDEGHTGYVVRFPDPV